MGMQGIEHMHVDSWLEHTVVESRWRRHTLLYHQQGNGMSLKIRDEEDCNCPRLGSSIWAAAISMKSIMLEKSVAIVFILHSNGIAHQLVNSVCF